MASNNAPKHDFAPAWLKIPSQENSKPPGSKQGEQKSEVVSRSQREDTLHSQLFNSDLSRLHRQHSLENYTDGSKRFPSGSGGKFRHHSVDDEYYAFPYSPYNYYNGYDYGMHYSSQPSLFRPPGPRDSKYQHPNARYGQPQVNGGYPGYYELCPPYDYYGDAYYPYQGRTSSKRNYYEKEGRSNSKEEKDKDREKKMKDGEKDKPFIDDFPSLNGAVDGHTSNGSKQTNGTGVWDNPPLAKNGSGKQPEEGGDTSQSKGQGGGNTYKSLVFNKSTIPRRPVRLNGSFSRETSSPFTGAKPPTPTSAHSTSPGYPSKEASMQSSTPPMDILNTRFVTQPKTLSDKKSQFLKALRQEDNEKHDGDKKSEEEKMSEGNLLNGMDSLGLEDVDAHLLSSSQEAEQRLLREMGWTESDEDEYEITEDDMKEFQNLTKQAQPNRNGLVRTLPKTWSPKHIPIYQPNVKELNEIISSSDSESDSGLTVGN